ncbi:hypothetical protein [Streptomyces sp. NPDC048142]|uniref:hypothetical protein n=1 Tax=Streptomyces sp. NPDC048142 TaxID=3365501 RepID=UPI00371EF95C
MTLRDIAFVLAGKLSDGCDGDAVVTAPVCCDLREVVTGGLFAAIEGDEEQSGVAYAQAAVTAGAVAVLAERELGVATIVVDDVRTALGRLAAELIRRLPTRTTVIAITGSAGKTSTKDVTAHLLNTLGRTASTAESRLFC